MSSTSSPPDCRSRRSTDRSSTSRASSSVSLICSTRKPVSSRSSTDRITGNAGVTVPTTYVRSPSSRRDWSSAGPTASTCSAIARVSRPDCATAIAEACAATAPPTGGRPPLRDGGSRIKTRHPDSPMPRRTSFSVGGDAVCGRVIGLPGWGGGAYGPRSWRSSSASTTGATSGSCLTRWRRGKRRPVTSTGCTSATSAGTCGWTTTRSPARSTAGGAATSSSRPRSSRTRSRRPRIAPAYVDDLEVCGTVAEAIDAIPHDEAWSDAQPGSVLRTLLVARGWTLDPDLWTALHLDLRTAEPFAVAGVTPTGEDVAARVDVQFHGFDRSTFTEDAWHRMAAGPGFDPALDLVAWDLDGVPVAGATAWSAGAGRCGILEPVATHREHRRAGHGRRVVHAAFNALAAAGASGVAVCTPGTNDSALGLYTAAGMRPVETLQALTRNRAQTALISRWTRSPRFRRGCRRSSTRAHRRDKSGTRSRPRPPRARPTTW